MANQAIIYPGESSNEYPSVHTGSINANNVKQSQSNVELTSDDLSNKVRTILLPKHYSIEPELEAELRDVGAQQGFMVEINDNMRLWAEDNMWSSRDGTKIFRPKKSLGDRKDPFFAFVVAAGKSPIATIEGHHSLGIKTSQGVKPYSLSQADSYAKSSGAELIKTFSIIDGGNMLTGKRENGTLYALVGRDAVLQTALRHTRFSKERIEAKRQQKEQAGEYSLSIIPHTFKGLYFQLNNDPEIDRLLLEAANLLPVGSTLEEQLHFAKLMVAKSEIMSAPYDQVKAATINMDVSHVKAKIINRYEELHGAPLPEGFDLDYHLNTAYGYLVTAANQTPEFDFSLIDTMLETLPTDRIKEKHYAAMLEAGGYIRTGLTDAEASIQARRFMAMMEIVNNKMAEELGVTRENLVILTQPGFHIDMHLRPLENGKVLINDYEQSKQFVENVIQNDTAISDADRTELQDTVTQLQTKAAYYADIYQMIHQQLIDAGLTPIKAIGEFDIGQRKVNWLNGIMGHGNSKFYVTNASSIPSLNNAFADWLKNIVPEISVYFVGHAPATISTHKTHNQAEALLRGSGGLDCVTIHFE
ncbi:hypothetical protein [Vibrio sp. S9_S30]|uniref:hypothetical protein n=1 Tax=Vibrio sp. S9_S30 TaxID=2720226 RepID=UPI001EEDAAD7|nr:hypothetical protein [Vibrio sp. S9_S30]